MLELYLTNTTRCMKLNDLELFYSLATKRSNNVMLYI
jgi:hypothetical protein